MPRALSENGFAPTATVTRLPSVPEPPIFDAPYSANLLAMFDASSSQSTQSIDATRLQLVQTIIESRKESSRSTSIALLVAWVSMVVLCGSLLVRVRRNRLRALRGDADAAHKIVLPAFEPLLWLLGGLNFTLFVVYGSVLIAYNFFVYHNRLTMELAVGVKQLNGMLVIASMLQPSVSRHALCRALWLALLLSFYTVPIVLLLNEIATVDNQRMCYWTLITTRFLVGIYLLRLVASPPTRASVWSFRLLCLYVVGMILMMYSMAETYHQGLPDVAGVLGWVIAGYSALLPLCVWHVLRADTEHWRGMGKRAVELQDTFRRKNARIEERVSSQGLHVLIEMHRKLIIDFARLQFHEPILEATKHGGNAATVYRGFLHTKKLPVAIKVYTPADFTEETVAEFSHEAALCGSLVHPNILTFHGLCVCPPNICLVAELCQSSLQDVLETRRHNEPLCQAQMLINVGHMIDAARALAYLHSFSPAFVHREIKPSNFLIDTNGTVKLTDFGASCTLAVRSTSHRPRPSAQQVLEYADSASMYSIATEDARQSRHNRGVREFPAWCTANAAPYVAPELIQGCSSGAAVHGEAADVFSLAITMWDILHPGKVHYPLASIGKATTSFGSLHHQWHRCETIFELVVAGHRPSLDRRLPSVLRELLEAAWHEHPRMRPRAQTIVTTLEAIQEALCTALAPEMIRIVGDSDRGVLSQPPRPGSPPDSPHDHHISFPGTEAVEKLCRDGFVDSQSQAIRLGSMLMDCGLLHHTTHARSFECSDSHYVFDGHQIRSCQPSRHERHHGPRSMERSSSCGGRNGSASSLAVAEKRCVCRRLGQRILTQPATRRRFHLNFKAFTYENLLTARLLGSGSHQRNSGGFTSHDTPRRCRRESYEVV